MISAGHHTMLKRTVKYPWDYRVAYFQVATTYPLFDCGVFTDYNENLINDTDATSQYNNTLVNGFSSSIIASFPNAFSTDQKICGNYCSFVCYPYSGRWNIGSFNSWIQTQPTASQVSNLVRTNTVYKVSTTPVGNRVARYTITDGSSSFSMDETLSASRRISMATTMPYPILLYNESGSYQVRNVSVGTRFYESTIYFDCPGNLETHLRFVPCVKDGVQYICEMSTSRLIPNTMSGTVISGPQVPDDYCGLIT